jgi:pimeloyl-ACP methyl ester carboxylesterase
MSQYFQLRQGLHVLAAASAISSFVATALAKEETPVAAPQLRWEPCGEVYPDTECAVASVPLDYDEPDGELIGIQLARVAGADAKATLFVNPGGPGGSGVDLIVGGFGFYLNDLLGGRFDIVGFDPRGVASSEPLFCFESEEDYLALLGDVPYVPYRVEQELPFFEANSAISEHCGNPRIREQMSTADVVRDLDRLRESVGDERISYLGFSYGSYIGHTYANLFPDKVGALVIDGVLDPVLWSSGLQVTSDRIATQDEFDEFLRLCDEAGSGCALSGEEGAGARYDVLETALLGAPLELGDSELSYDQFIYYALGAMYAPELDWGGAEGFGAWFRALYDTVLGEPGAAERASAILAAIDARWAPLPPFAGFDNGSDAYLGNHCADTEYPEPFEDFANIGIYADRGSAFGPAWWWSNAGCASWPISQDRYAGPWTAETSAPVLVVGNYFDGVTDYEGAVASAALLPNSRLLSYAGWGHTAFGANDCTTDHIVSYLVSGTLPPEGTVCAANPNPFIAHAELDVASSPTLEVGSAAPPSWHFAVRPRPLSRRLGR